MTLSRKFAKAAGIGLLGATLLAAVGCGPQTPQERQADAQQTSGVYTDACVVVDRQPGYPYQQPNSFSYSNTYDFRNGVLLIGTTYYGTLERETSAVPLSQLNDGGKARAMDMYNKLPATAYCEAPKPGK